MQFSTTCNAVLVKQSSYLQNQLTIGKIGEPLQRCQLSLQIIWISYVLGLIKHLMSLLNVRSVFPF